MNRAPATPMNVSLTGSRRVRGSRLSHLRQRDLRLLREGVVREHTAPLAVAPLHRRYHDVQRRQRPLELQPREAAAAGRVWAERVLDHQSLIAALARLLEYPVEVERVGRLLEAREQ